jgi:hypothetical protein
MQPIATVCICGETYSHVGFHREPRMTESKGTEDVVSKFDDKLHKLIKPVKKIARDALAFPPLG